MRVREKEGWRGREGTETLARELGPLLSSARASEQRRGHTAHHRTAPHQEVTHTKAARHPVTVLPEQEVLQPEAGHFIPIWKVMQVSSSSLLCCLFFLSKCLLSLEREEELGES